MRSIASDTDLEEALRRAGSVEAVIDLFHEMARVASALYGAEDSKNEHIRGLLSEQLIAPSANVLAGSGSETANPMGRPEKAARQAARAAKKAERASRCGTVPEPKTAILDILLNDRRSLKLLYNPEQDAAFTRLLSEGLKARCEQYNAPITYHGRNPAGTRYNFDLTEDGLPVTLARLFASDPQNRPGLQYRLEAAMKNFVRWNPNMFLELNRGNDNNKYSQITPGSPTSTLEILRVVDGLDALPAKSEHWPNLLLAAPWHDQEENYSRASDFSLSATYSYAGHDTHEDRSQEKAKKAPKGAQWSLSAPTPAALQHGFYGKLTAHLSDPDMTAEPLEAALDLDVYKLAMQEPKAWPELFGANAEIVDREKNGEADSDAGGVAISEDEEDDDREDEAMEGDTEVQMMIAHTEKSAV